MFSRGSDLPLQPYQDGLVGLVLCFRQFLSYCAFDFLLLAFFAAKNTKTVCIHSW